MMENATKLTNWKILAEIELVYRNRVRPSQRPRIGGPKDAAVLLMESWNESKIEFVEQFKILLLNRGNRVLGIVELSSGGVSSTVADPKLIFSAALKANACGIILCHNHPSGNTTPSAADHQITARIKAGGNYLEIKVLDHIIITSEGYYSFAEQGLL